MQQTNICPVDNIVRWRYGPKGDKSLDKIESSSDPKSTSNGLEVNDIDPRTIPQSSVSFFEFLIF